MVFLKMGIYCWKREKSWVVHLEQSESYERSSQQQESTLYMQLAVLGYGDIDVIIIFNSSYYSYWTFTKRQG